ncbi:MAG: phosphonate ABC transporter, permease protein PhnE [Epsilonproteobacteria bacterium]|nr:MAG: phosphonate ABC transporter, permease protein PhnE [Campylobacterota bacterium]RLA67044.1 MAG: phosphonate ABC transporter, permease protein PhnE [Campylobacterota bacterium]
MEIRYPEFSWGEPLVCLVLGLIVSSVIYFLLPRLSIGRAIYFKTYAQLNKPLLKRPYIYLGLFIFLITLISGLYVSQVSLREFFSHSGLMGAKRIFIALFTPNFGILEHALFAAIETIYMAFIATLFAIPVAFVLSFFAAKNLMRDSIVLIVTYSIIRFILNLTRSIEPLIWAIIFSVWVGIGPFSGMMALCIHSIASLSKLYSEQIEGIDEGTMESITATGAKPIQVVWFGVVPQIILPFISFTIYRWDINVRMATIIGLVGGGGIGTLLMQYQGLAKWNEVGLLVIIIASIVWAMDYISTKIRQAIK